MFWPYLVLCSLCLAHLVLDWRQRRVLVLGGLVGMLHSGLFLALPLPGPLMEFTDSGPITEHWALVVMLQTAVAPVLTAWYGQGLDPAKPPPIARTAAFTLISFSLASMGQSAGRLVFAPWWSPAYSLLGYLAMYLVTWKSINFVYACGSPDRKGDRSVRVR